MIQSKLVNTYIYNGIDRYKKRLIKEKLIKAVKKGGETVYYSNLTKQDAFYPLTNRA